MEKQLNFKDILLLLLYVPGVTKNVNEPILGRTRIVKMMFLFDKEISKSFKKDSKFEKIQFPEFVSFHFGPFSKEIYQYLDFFINNGFIEDSYLRTSKSEAELSEYGSLLDDIIVGREDPYEYETFNEESFQLTDRGKRFVDEKLYSLLTENQKSILKKFKSSINDASLSAILRYTYLKYPEYTSKSKIKDQVIG